MEKKQRIVEYRERLDNTLASHDLVHKESIKNLVRNHLVRSSTSDIHGYVDNFLEKRTDEVSHFLDMLRSASRSDTEVSKTDGMPHRDWKLKQDNEDFRVMYREGPEGTPFHTLLVEGYIDGPVDVCLCLSWEAALFKKWWPQFHVPPFKITTSDCLQEVRIGEEIIHMRVKVAWPLSAREVILHYFELEYFEDDLIIVLLKSISDKEGVDKSTHGFSKDVIPDAKEFVRMDVVGGFVMQKVTSNISYFRYDLVIPQGTQTIRIILQERSNSSRSSASGSSSSRSSSSSSIRPFPMQGNFGGNIRTIANVDIKLDFVPPSFINFVSRQLIGSGFKLYKKTVASIAKGDEEFSKALMAPLYVRIREGLTPKSKPKRSLKQEAHESEKAAKLDLDGLGTKIPQIDTMVIEHIHFGDSHATTSSQESKPIPVLAYNSEIEEVEVEQERPSEEKYQTSHGKIEVEVEQETRLKEDKLLDHSTAKMTAAYISKEKALISAEIEEVEAEQETQSAEKYQMSYGKIEVEVEQETDLKEDEITDYSKANLTADYINKEKTLISPEVEQALCVLDNAISMVRQGFSIQNWSGFGSNNQEQLQLQSVAAEVGSTSSEERSDDGVCLKAPKVDNMEALWEDESSSGFFDIRHDKQDSPPQGVNHNQITPASPKRNSTPLNTTQDDAFYSSRNGKMLEAPVVDNLSRDSMEVTVKINGHDGDDKVGEFRQKKQRRCCLYFFHTDR